VVAVSLVLPTLTRKDIKSSKFGKTEIKSMSALYFII